MMRTTRRAALYAFLVCASAANALAQVKLDTIGPQVGTRAPEFSGVDQFGKTQTLGSVLGPEGAMLVFFRSADW